MTHPKMLLLVRLKSGLDPDAVMKMVEARAPEFQALEGLQQKYYVRDRGTGEYGGVYLWESATSLADYRKSELRESIAEAYRAEGEPRIEVYEVIKVLRE
jgi:heme-degrading monooxygenase HmoA